MNIAVIFAGGSGTRMGAGIPKQYLEINGKPILIYTLQLFEYHREIDAIYLAVPEEYIGYTKVLVEDFHIHKVRDVIAGGETAQNTIYNALKRAEQDAEGDDIVLLHDGVRPFVSYDVISRNIAGVKKMGNAITCTPCFETILVSHDGKEVNEVPYRKETFAAQAPQSFYLKDIIEAHEKIQKRPEGYENMIDACTIIRTVGGEAHMVEGNRGNIKVTTPEDVYTFRALLQYRENEQTFGLGMTDQINARMEAERKRF